MKKNKKSQRFDPHRDSLSHRAAKPPSMLYKYVRSERWDVLLGRIRYTQPMYLNDPFEVAPYIKGFASDKEIAQLMGEQLDKTLTEELSKASLGAVSPDFSKAIADFVRPTLGNLNDQINITLEYVISMMREKFLLFKEKTAVLSLTESHENLLMWSHYADQHRGFVIGVDSAGISLNFRKTDQDEFRHPRPVLYSYHRPQLMVQDMNFESLALTKSREWAYEKEWRVFASVDDAIDTIEQNEVICLFNLDVRDIKELYLGALQSDESRIKICSILRATKESHDCRLYSYVLDDKDFGIRAEEVKYRSEDISSFIEILLAPSLAKRPSLQMPPGKLDFLLPSSVK